MRIVEVGSNSVHFVTFLDALKSQSLELVIVSEETIEGQSELKNHLISFRNLNPFRVIKNYGALKRTLKKIDPDVIHIHQVNRLAYFTTRAANKLKIPVLTTAWGSDVLVVPKRNKFSHFIVKKTLERSKAVTADSHEMIDAMKLLVPQGNYTWVQYGITPVEPQTKEKLVYSNRLHRPLYRIDKIIDYFADFNVENPDWRLVIGATGEDTDALKQKVMEMNLQSKVDFVGWLDGTTNKDYYARSMIYISIPHSDGTSVSLLEAMSAGCIPVVSDLKVSHEWISSNENGIIESPGVNPLKSALQLDQKKCEELNQEIVFSKATRTRSVEVFNQLYNQLANDK